MAEVRVAIVGVGNCASSLIQGIEYYRGAIDGNSIPGIMHVMVGPYHIKDVKFVAAFDVDQNKVGKDLGEAVFTEPNNTVKFSDVPPLDVRVLRGPTLDGLGKYYREVVTESSEPVVDVSETLIDTGAQVLICLLYTSPSPRDS